MPWDETLAQNLRGDLRALEIREQKMFGGLAFLHRGHMVCGIHRGGAMFRVGKANEPAALGVAGASRMQMGEREMPGMITASAPAMEDPQARGALIALALDCVTKLPPK